MAKAFLTIDGKEVIVAQSEETIKIEGNHYFPPKSVKKQYFVDSDTHTVCHWKGEASYKTIKVENDLYEDSAWYYPKPLSSAIRNVGKDFSNYFAFWRGVKVEE